MRFWPKSYGASVTIDGTDQGVMTDIDGKYSIDAASTDVLTFSYIGYQSQSIAVGSRTTIDVQLAEDTQALDEVVVTGYATQAKKDITGSVAVVSRDAIAEQPVSSFAEALQGRAAGVTITNAGGPAGDSQIRIRGVGSVNGSDPLIIVDGVQGVNISSVNPNDIETMQVLKDAAATAIYGARAANGVIVITTKRGRNMDQPNINYRMQMGWSAMAHGNWDLMNTQERIQYEKELGLTSGQNYDYLSTIDVNWMDVVFNDSAMLQSHEVSVSGATETTNYYFSGGYYDQEGIAPGSQFTRYSMRFNFEQQMARWLKMGTNTMFNYQDILQADEGAYTLVTPISAARFMQPYWNPYKADGSLASINDGSWKGSGQNPLEWLANNPLAYKKYKLFSTVFAEFTLYKNLVFKSQFGVDFSHTTGFSQSFPDYAPNLGEGSAARSSSDGLNLQLSNTLTYRFNVNDMHDFNFLLGHEWQDYHMEAFSVSTAGQNNKLLTDISTGTRATSWSSTSASDYSRVSFFGRAEYNYSDRYYAEVSLRTDGSSRFGANNRWGVFGAVGFMWNLRNENFMAGARNWLTMAQIAVSSGTSGNSEIPNYEHLALIGGGSDYVGDAGVAPLQPGNESLTWENTWTSGAGMC